MRKIDVRKIEQAVKDLCLKANFELRPDVLAAIKKARRAETNERARRILDMLIENAAIAKRERLAVCQDTGMACVFLEIGQEVALVGGDLKKAVDRGVAAAYREGSLRKSVVRGPFDRVNTGTNTPASCVLDIVPGETVRIAVSPKGFGSENKSMIRMFRPTAPWSEIREFVLEVVKRAGPDACPPLVLGVGIGGTFDKAALLAKKALLRPIDGRNADRRVAALERELALAANRLGVGPMGLGGKTTVCGVNIITAPTHIAGLPVAVNVSCHATRSASATL